MPSPKERRQSELWQPTVGMLYVHTIDFPPFPLLAGSTVSTIDHPHDRQLLVYYKPTKPKVFDYYFYGKLFDIYKEDRYVPRIPSQWEGHDSDIVSQIWQNEYLRVERALASNEYLSDLMRSLMKNVDRDRLNQHINTIGSFVPDDYLLPREMTRLNQIYQQVIASSTG